MAEYSRLQYYAMMSAYFRAGNPHDAARLYEVENAGLPRSPDYRVFYRLNLRLRNEGVLRPAHAGNGRIAGVPEELEELILSQYEADPTLSIKLCAVRLETNYSAVRLTLKANGKRPWHFQKVHQLVGLRDYIARINFCNDLLQMVAAVPAYPRLFFGRMR